MDPLMSPSSRARTTARDRGLPNLRALSPGGASDPWLRPEIVKTSSSSCIHRGWPTMSTGQIPKRNTHRAGLKRQSKSPD